MLSGVTDRNDEYVRKIAKDFEAAGIRCEVDARNEKINYKIREHMATKVTFVGIAGDREAEEGTITVRRLGGGRHEDICGRGVHRAHARRN